MQLNSVEELISDLRQGRMVVLIDDNTQSGNEGVVMMAAEHVTATAVNFMAQQARGLVCLALTQERCELLNLPPMVAGAEGEKSNFTLSIEAATGVETGISAADRALTVQAAVAPHAVAADIVQPGHIFPLTVAPGGVLTRAGHTEAASDYMSLAGLSPFAMMADVLTPDGDLADGTALADFARQHQLKMGSIADLIQFRVMNERTIERVREGDVDTAYGRFKLVAYRDQISNDIHLALTRGTIDANQPTVVRVHVASSLRDLLGTRTLDQAGWDINACLATIADSERGALVLISRTETAERLLASVDMVLGNEIPLQRGASADAYTTVGLGSQILRDLGVGHIHLIGAPIKYNAIAGFGLEVLEYVQPLPHNRG